MRRRDWPTTQQLADQLGTSAGNLRLVAAKVAASGRSFKRRSRNGQVCWHLDPSTAGTRPADRNRPRVAKRPRIVPIQVTIHIPEALLRRLFGS